jgi:[ribosomal protein S5]-alanine N-acetyltransferase
MPLFQPAVLRTPRLVLRPLDADDVMPLFALYADPQFMRYYSFAPFTRPEQAAERLARLMATAASGRDFNSAITVGDGGPVIGACSLFNADEACQRAEIGFGVHPAHWGRGYAGETVRALIDHAFDTLKLRRIEADIDPRNLGSARVLEGAGFVREGLLRERWLVNGEVSDSALYGLLPRDRASR